MSEYASGIRVEWLSKDKAEVSRDIYVLMDLISENGMVVRTKSIHAY